MAISKFNSVFSRTNNKEIKAPTALRKKLNLEAPREYTYELMEGSKDVYVLRSKKIVKRIAFRSELNFLWNLKG